MAAAGEDDAAWERAIAAAVKSAPFSAPKTLTLDGASCGATLRGLDLGNNRFAEVDELAPLAPLGIESLDLYQCPVTKVKGYREKVFALIPSLKYLDGMDAEGNDRLESDEEEDDEEEDDEEGAEGEGEGDEEEEGGEEGEGDEDDEEEESEGDEEDDDEGDEEAEDEEDEADDNQTDKDAEDESKVVNGGSAQSNKRKRDNEDDANGDN
uniref:U2A'/phosphoprotein 32 family A C-terminal domain-containing protein n=1 Tax=Oryza brachyantha TaxID=4533 RepID=J3LRF8_ORYBR